MNRRVAGVLVVLLAAATASILLVGGLGLGESPGAQSDGTTSATSDTTATDATTDRTAPGGDANGSAAETTETPPTATPTTTATAPNYDFTIERVEECGTTCRDVTARLANAGAATRRNVRVTTKVYADGDLLWRGNETVGALAPGEAHTSTKRVKLGFSGAMKIRNNGGYVTIVTVVESDGGTTRFSDRRKVA